MHNNSASSVLGKGEEKVKLDSSYSVFFCFLDGGEGGRKKESKK